ncbi:MAG: PAS domain-containing protein [Symplocastrum torsivum CPER-KK1]|jgi:PAS domain S-box-containing protein|uniref:PAS domain-containing protein n=1 Tax=Symplocastrum torsivum CPER-KK1 TaxID=450513 RepID=A0A951PGL1_9CYAN|nr:PAS domain-containing protein [Symplocastrum torsivum CPER-KK1]
MDIAKQDVILIVDDNSTNLKMLFSFLKDSGFKVLVANDGESAIEKLQEVSPDLILLDVMMPGIDGFETCHRLKASVATKDIPVIFMTVLSETVDKLKGLSLGAVDYITKPFQQEEVLARVRLHLKMRNLTKTLEEQNVLLKQEIEARLQAETELQNLTQELEQRVEERTAELTHTLHNLQQTQVQLLENEALLRTVVTNAPIILYALDSEGVITLSEGKGLEALGQKPGQTVGQSAFELYRNYPKILEDLRRGLAGKQSSCITQIGDVVYDNQAIPLRDKNGQVIGLIGVATDITQFKQAQDALSLSEKRFRLAVDHFPDTFVIYDANRQFQFVNAHGVRIGGLPELALIGHTDEEIHPPEITNAYLPHLLKAVETRTSQTAECTITLPTVGKVTFIVIYIPLLDERGEIYQILGIRHNITEQKIAEEKLKESHEFLQTVLDTNPNLIFVKDSQGKLVLGNQAFADFVGVNAEKLQGTTDAELYPNQEDVQRFIAQDQEVFTTLKQKFITEELYHTRMGEVQWFQTIKKPIFSSDGQVAQVLGVSTNITQRKLAEIQIQESLREKEVLLQEIHHRVKNNLQVILSLLDLQSQHIKEQATLEIFRESCSRVRSMALVHETFYKSKHFAKINFTEYIQDLTSYLFATYGVNIETINLELELDEVSLNIDTAIPCGLIVNELVSNALKYAFPNLPKGIIYVALDSDEKYHILTVKDNGIGLPLGFNIQALKSLGLQLVSVLTAQLEGTLELDRTQGTEFRIRFPKIIDVK